MAKLGEASLSPVLREVKLLKSVSHAFRGQIVLVSHLVTYVCEVQGKTLYGRVSREARVSCHLTSRLTTIPIAYTARNQ